MPKLARFVPAHKMIPVRPASVTFGCGRSDARGMPMRRQDSVGQGPAAETACAPPVWRAGAPLLLALLALAPCVAVAAESEAVASRRVTATLVSDTDSHAPGRPFHLGLRLRMTPGWHTYWTNPGDAGAATLLALTLPQRLAASPVAWPAPERILEGDLAAYAYTGDVLLPVTVSGTANGTLPLRAHAEWLVCATVCVPESGDFALDLAAGDGAASPQHALFEQAAARTPAPSPFAARVAPDGTLSLSGREISPAAVRDAYFFPRSPTVLTQSAPQALSVQDGALTLKLPVAAGFDARAGLDGVLRLTDARGGASWLDVAATPGAAAAAGPAAVAQGVGVAAMLRTLLLAFAGGLVLNLMPCVFPVLAMKAMALARLSGASRGEVRRQAAGYTAGVVAAFAALGGTMLLLRGAGAAAGWGFQFQSPVFVTITAWVLFAVGLGLSGVVTPVSGLEGVGQGLASRGGVTGSVFTGLLAVLVATPCTAPFMGVAIAAAFAAPPVLAMAVFLAMGLGLAAPTVLLAAAPGLARGLPRPGAWMDVLKQAFAFPMYAASAWLAWVVAEEAGPSGVMLCLAGAVAIGFAAWTWGVSRGAGRAVRSLGGAAALLGVAVAATGLVSLGQAAPGASAATAQAGDGSEPFSVARLDSLRAQGRPVFVDMTAAWCFTCLVNERVALSPQPVRDAFAHRDVAYLKGDWTRQDPQITAFLREHGRDGVPLYVFYPAGGGAPSVLPQILTPSGVLAALGQG
jgi:thiol:disulfide interchange protein/DsbC/DsbD-like thiol-disulfide interchange protein